MIDSNFNEIEFTLGGKIERFAAYVIDSLVALLAILPLGIPFLLAINDFSNGSMESINSISIESNRNFTLGVLSYYHKRSINRENNNVSAYSECY